MSYKMEVSSNQNKAWSLANGQTKTSHDRFKVSAVNHSDCESCDTN